MKKICLYCKYWLRNSCNTSKKVTDTIPVGDKFLDCRRRSPVVLYNGVTVWPKTDWNDYCGDFVVDRRFIQ